MPIDRISTISVHQQTLNDVGSTQARIAKLNVQISSGQKFNDFREMARGGSLEKVFSFETELRNTEQFITSNTSISARLENMNAHIENIHKIASDYKNLLVSYRSGSKSRIELEQLARDSLDKLDGELNANLEGRFLFAGSKTNQPAVSNLRVSNIVNDEPTAMYYDGDNTQMEARLTETFNITYGITANDEGFKNLIASLHRGIEAERLGSDVPITRDGGALDLVDQAMDRIEALQTQTLNQMGHVRKASEQHTDYKTYIQGVSNELTDTDIAGATISLTTDQTILQASFMTFSRMSSLTLTEYLR